MSKTEAQTRSELIDQQLAQSGWNVKDPSQVIEEFDILVEFHVGVAEARTPYEGHQFSDYVLLGKDGKPLAVIEAKKTSRDAALGLNPAPRVAAKAGTAIPCRPSCVCARPLRSPASRPPA